MNVLFIGGTGIISTACSRLAIARGMELTLVTRGRAITPPPAGCKTIRVDIHDEGAFRSALSGSEFDVVVDWLAYVPADIERDLRLFAGRTRQFIFISSASAYQKPPAQYMITEATPMENRFWQYSRDKIACEQRLLRACREEGFPGVIVRPSLTYGETLVPLAINSWERSYTVVDRMLRGKPVIVPGDGTSLWVITHNTDFAKGLLGLFGKAATIGEAFHITTDEVHTWNDFYLAVGAAAGVEARLVHLPSEFMVACVPDNEGTLLGDKAHSVVFDNSKIKRFVPDFRATTTFAEGIRETLAWFNADPARKQIDAAANAEWDELIAGYETGVHDAARRLSS